jgi:cytidylate kinase
MTDSEFKIVALDGGAASGKSSTSRGVAQRLNLLYVNSGEFYRLLTHYFLEQDITAKNLEEIEAALKKLSFESRIQDGSVVCTIGGELVDSEELRSPVVNANVSLFAAKRPLREFLLQHLRQQADSAREGGYKGLIMEGRDIGTVIFPDADFKFFLSASEETREQRRQEEGQMDLVVQRDQLDAKRSAAPFVPADRSIRINTDDLDLQEVIDLVSGIILTGKVPGAFTTDPFGASGEEEDEGWDQDDASKIPGNES